ncbi:DUF2283 domain-containing protein [Methanothermococcus okinawensis]|uniref:DUF2283 domain-containing protein n=1 Tax=Methanothermococcus okinawensis (strain DSM 14208 / JCM 11175 / IH1) TaxID=647113 RepID=F8AJM8_METOI|nr:DUF2283 domain-containing protein [Methanothermococcus okinawensis]AEH07216.1 Protein of unknown function DUF2283 [Methanothermococcus okinawensis IH1]
MTISVDYDFENDDLFVYKKGAKSKMTIDLDDVLLDFDNKGIVGMEILDASKIFKVDKYDLLKNLIKFEAVIKITKDVIKLNMKLEVLKRNKEIVRESTIKGLNYNGLNEGEMEITC